MKPAAIALVVIVFSLAAFASFAQKPTFEAASIRLAPLQGESNTNIGLHMDGSQVRFTYLPLKDYISRAYRLKPYQIIGPDWLNEDRFDIMAKLPDGAVVTQIPEMLATLLEERFHLRMHREAKDFAVYSLEPGKGGIRLNPIPTDLGAPGTLDVTVTVTPNGTTRNYGDGSTLTFSQRGFEGRKVSMRALAEALTWYVDRPVVDRTGTTGNYDMVLEISAEDSRAMGVRSAVVAGVALPPALLALLENPWGDSLVKSLSKAGLVLEARKAPVEVIVIDSVDKTPTDN